MATSKSHNESAHDVLVMLHSMIGLLSRLEDRTCIKGAGISFQQFLILITIESAKPPVSQTVIARKIERGLNSVSMILDRMEQQGLVTRIRSKADRRESHVSVTPDGKGKLSKALVVCDTLMGRLATGFSKTEFQESLRLMSKLRDQVRKELEREPTELTPVQAPRRRATKSPRRRER